MDQGKLTVTDGTFTGGEDTVALATMGGSANSGAIAITGGRFDGDIILAETSDGGSLKLAGDVVVKGDVINKAKDDGRHCRRHRLRHWSPTMAKARWASPAVRLRTSRTAH